MPLKLTLIKERELVFEEYTDLDLTPTSVRLKTVYSGISHGSEKILYQAKAPKSEYTWNSDYRHFSRNKCHNSKPQSIGYESVARVEDIGSMVDGWQKGDLVWIDAPHRETHLLDVNGLVPYTRFSANTDPKKIALFAITRVALGGVHDINPIIGDSIGVCGLGAVGLTCIQLLKKAGVRKIVGIDTFENRLKLAEEFGAIAIDYSTSDPAESVKDLIGPLDAAIEASGSYAGLTTAIRCVAQMGCVSVVSSYGNQSEGILLGHEFHRNRITLISSMTINGNSHPKHPHWNLDRLNKEAALLLTDGSLSTDKLISDVIPFRNAPAAFESMLSNQNPPLKILLSYE